MKIAIDISPIDKNSTSGHKVRGVGKYIALLKDNLVKFDKHNNYIFTTEPESEECDIIHYPYFDPFFINLPLKKTKPTIVTVHDLIPLIHSKQFPVGIKGGLKWKLNKKILKGQDAIITDSIASKEDIQTLTGIPDNKISPIYLPADKEFKHLVIPDTAVKEMRKKYDLTDEFFIYVGDVTWNKNLPRIVKAVIQTNVSLVMVGKAIIETDFDRRNPWNHDRIEIMNITQGNPLFIKPGFVSTEDLAILYNMALALLMPSLDEGFGFPVLEAMSCGCPVITSNNGSLPEVGGDAVLYADPENAESIADCIIKVQDNDLAIQLKKKGFEQASKFTAEKFISETVEVYDRVYHHA